MKYIIVKDRNDEEHAIVFPDAIIHKDVARIHRATDVRVISAGICDIKEPIHLPSAISIAWGESESLKMKARIKEDSKIILKDFFNYVKETT